jgi:hypothetical protein
MSAGIAMKSVAAPAFSQIPFTLHFTWVALNPRHTVLRDQIDADAARGDTPSRLSAVRS